jgi:hypothetical protein
MTTNSPISIAFEFPRRRAIALPAPRSGAGTSFKVPPKAPIAVRTGSAITTERDAMT